MCEQGLLADGTKIEGPFSMLVGAVANPFLKPLELNLLRLHSKIEAGARFIQTHAVFDLDAFGQWLEAVRQAGFTKQVAILAGVFPLESAEEARKLRETHPDFYVPDEVMKKLPAAGNGAGKIGRAMCAETIKKLQGDGRCARNSYSLGWQGSRGAGAACRRRAVVTGKTHAGKISHQDTASAAARPAHRQTWRGGLAGGLRPVP